MPSVAGKMLKAMGSTRYTITRISTHLITPTSQFTIRSMTLEKAKDRPPSAVCESILRPQRKRRSPAQVMPRFR